MTVASDNFNRADSATLGSNWTPTHGTTNIAILSNQIHATGDSLMYWNAVSFAADQYSLCVVGSPVGSGNDYLGPTCRSKTAADSFYGYQPGAPGDRYFFKVVSGSYTEFASGSRNEVAGDTIKIQAVGTTITAFLNGAAQFGGAVTDSSITGTSAAPGLNGYETGTGFPITSWEGGDVGGTTYTVSVGGTLTPAGSLIKQDNKVAAGTLGTSGLLQKREQKVFSGSLTSSGLLAKQANKILSGVLTSIGSLFKQDNKTLSGSLTSGGLLQKQVNKILAGGITPTGALSNIKTAILTVGGTLTSSGGLSKQVGKVVSGTLPSVGNLVKQANKLLAGNLTSSGLLTKLKTSVLTVGGTLGSSGVLSKQTQKNIGGSLTSTGGLAKQIRKFFGGILTSIGNLIAVNTGGTTILAGFDIADVRRNPVNFAPLARPIIYGNTENGVHYDQKHIKTQFIQTRSLTIYGD